jgi:hypothetical protein
MTILDRVQAQVSTAVNFAFDKEPLSYIEVAGLYGIVLGGRQNVAILALLYNHAGDSDLKALLKKAIDEQTEWLTSQAEKMLADSGGQLPDIHFRKRTLHDTPPNISEDARYSDQEIVLALANMAKASQMAVLATMHQSYQPFVAKLYQDTLDAAFDFNYRLMQLAITKGWLPYLHKMKH